MSISLSLQYSSSNNITYQVPLFFIVAEQGPDNTLVSITSPAQFLQIYGSKIPQVFESYIYAYRLSQITPIYCYKLQDPKLVTANLQLALIDYNSQTYIVPGYIDFNGYLNVNFQGITYYSTSFVQLYSLSALYNGILYNGNVYYQSNTIFIQYNNNTSLDAIDISTTNVGNSYTLTTNIFYQNNPVYNINVWSGTSFTLLQSLTINNDTFIWLLNNILQSTTYYSITGATSPFIRFGVSFDEDAYVNAINSITLTPFNYIKYIVQPSSTYLSLSSITTINTKLYQIAKANQISFAGSLYYAYTPSNVADIQSELCIYYNQLIEVYYPEIGEIKIVPIHYEALSNIIRYRLLQNNNSTSILYFNDTRLSLPYSPISTTQIAIGINYYPRVSNLSNINLITNLQQGYAQVTFRTTSKQNNALVYEYIVADILDLANRIYRVLTGYKHQLNLSTKQVKKAISEIINYYHIDMLDSFDIYVNAIYELNLIQVVVMLDYKSIAETVSINIQV